MKTLIATVLSLAITSSAFAADRAVIDRFSDQAGHLFNRNQNPALPAADAPINFDQGPFITRGFGPSGEKVSYYNFDVQSEKTAPIYVLFRAGDSAPVQGQDNIVGVIPGDSGYSDFWNVVKVTVPQDYVPNSLHSVADLLDQFFPMQATTTIVNCPVVPAGSTAQLRYNGNADTGLHNGWYNGLQVSYFNFSEKDLALTSGQKVPTSPIYVSFNKNPDMADPTSGPASGFVAESSGQTHNVIASLPEDDFYSPLWDVNVFDNQAFASVSDLSTASLAHRLANHVAKVNCPVVSKSAN